MSLSTKDTLYTHIKKKKKKKPLPTKQYSQKPKLLHKVNNKTALLTSSLDSVNALKWFDHVCKIKMKKRPLWTIHLPLSSCKCACNVLNIFVVIKIKPHCTEDLYSDSHCIILKVSRINQCY